MIGSGEREAAEVVVKPIGEAATIAREVGPRFTAVLGAGFYDEPCGGAGSGGAGDVELGLLNRDERVGVAVDDECGGGGGGGVAGGGKSLAEFLAAFGREGVGAEGGDVVLQDAAADGDFALAAVVEKIGGRIKAGDGLDGAAGAVDGVFGIGGAGAALRAERERKMAAGAGAGDAEVSGIDGPAGGIVANEADGAV